MKRFLTFAILFHWMMFFALHAIMALAGATVFGFPRASMTPGSLPMVEGGMGAASIFASVLFGWALLAAMSAREEGKMVELDLERIAFVSSAFVFSVLSMMAIIGSNSEALMAASAYLAALLVSWAAAAVEWEQLSVRALKHSESAASRHARQLAGDAGWHTGLSRISGREETR
jgi:hypothetical protein